jgi:hypothetical protein
MLTDRGKETACARSRRSTVLGPGGRRCLGRSIAGDGARRRFGSDANILKVVGAPTPAQAEERFS